MTALEDVRIRLRKARERSVVVRYLREARAATADAVARARALTPEEITGLEARGNLCDTWADVRVSGNATLDTIRNCRFEGSVILRLEAGPATLWNSRFRNVV